MSVNKVIIVGRCGKDPEVRYLSDGGAVVNLSVATSEKYKDKSGQVVENTEWHRIVMYGKVAEIAGQYVKKGTMAYFEGKLKTRKWQDQSGQDKYTTEIVCDRMQLLGGKSDETPSQQSKPAKQSGNAVADMTDDIPF